MRISSTLFIEVLQYFFEEKTGSATFAFPRERILKTALKSILELEKK